MEVNEIAYWYCENVLTMVALIFISIAILLAFGLLIYGAVIGVRGIVKSIRSKRK